MDHTKFIDKQFWVASLIRFNIAIQLTENALNNPNFKEFLRHRHHFDVIIVDMLMPDACLALGYYFKAPVIALTPYPSPTWFSEMAQLPVFPADMLNLRRTDLAHMSLYERIYNSLVFWADEILKHWYYLPKQEQLMHDTFGNNSDRLPSFMEIRQNVTLVLLDSYTTFNTPRPYLPNLMKIEGLYTKAKSAKLPNNVQDFLDAANDDGAIFISLGSNVNLTTLPPHQKYALCNAFKGYPKTRLLIKADDDTLDFPSHKPEDVLIDPWYSQDSALAHPNVRVFVTYGDLLSTSGEKEFSKFRIIHNSCKLFIILRNLFDFQRLIDTVNPSLAFHSILIKR